MNHLRKILFGNCSIAVEQSISIPTSSISNCGDQGSGIRDQGSGIRDQGSEEVTGGFAVAEMLGRVVLPPPTARSAA
jgi:hypothetical protein